MLGPCRQVAACVMLQICTESQKTELYREKKGEDSKYRIIFPNAKANFFSMRNVTQTGDMSATYRTLTIMLRYAGDKCYVHTV